MDLNEIVDCFKNSFLRNFSDDWMNYQNFPLWSFASGPLSVSFSTPYHPFNPDNQKVIHYRVTPTNNSVQIMRHSSLLQVFSHHKIGLKERLISIWRSNFNLYATSDCNSILIEVFLCTLPCFLFGSFFLSKPRKYGIQAKGTRNCS